MGRAQEADSSLNDPKVKEIADKHGKSTAQVSLRWAVQRGTAVIPKSSNADRIASNADLFSFKLSDEEMETISNMNVNRRFNDPGHWWEKLFGTYVPIFD